MVTAQPPKFNEGLSLRPYISACELLGLLRDQDKEGEWRVVSPWQSHQCVFLALQASSSLNEDTTPRPHDCRRLCTLESPESEGAWDLSENGLQNELSKSPERGILNIELKFPGTSRGELGWDAADFTFAGVREIGRRFVPSSAFPAGRHGARVDEDGFTARSV